MTDYFCLESLTLSNSSKTAAAIFDAVLALCTSFYITLKKSLNVITVPSQGHLNRKLQYWIWDDPYIEGRVLFRSHFSSGLLMEKAKRDPMKITASTLLKGSRNALLVLAWSGRNIVDVRWTNPPNQSFQISSWIAKCRCSVWEYD